MTQAPVLESKFRFALVSLVSKKGSSYLQPGARLLVCEDGRYWGEISAGCLEEKVSAHAIDCIRSGGHQLLTIDTRPHYGCFGEITLLIEVIRDGAGFRELLASVDEARIKREVITIATNYRNLNEVRLTALNTKRATVGQILEETLQPPIQLIVLGDWPDGRSSSDIAQSLGWETKVYDATSPTFKVNEALSTHTVDPQTAVLVATHNLARDVSCLAAALRHRCGYIGVVGSHKRRNELARLICEYDDFSLIENFVHVSCPAGLDLGGDGAQSIALSIVAQIQSQLFGRSHQPLCERKQPIHAEEVSI